MSSVESRSSASCVGKPDAVCLAQEVASCKATKETASKVMTVALCVLAVSSLVTCIFWAIPSFAYLFSLVRISTLVPMLKVNLIVTLANSIITAFALSTMAIAAVIYQRQQRKIAQLTAS